MKPTSENDMLKKSLIRFIANLYEMNNFTEEPTCPKLYSVEWKLLDHDFNHGYDYNLLSQNDSVLKYQAEFDNFSLIFSVQTSQTSEEKYNLEARFGDDSSIYQFPYVLDDTDFQVKLAHLHCKISNQITEKFEQLEKCIWTT